MMETVPVLLPVSGRPAVRVRGILKGLLIASIDHWPSSLLDSAKNKCVYFFFMVEKDAGQRKLYGSRLRDLLLCAEAQTRGRHRPRQEILEFLHHWRC